jgi:hypothetical protein
MGKQDELLFVWLVRKCRKSKMQVILLIIIIFTCFGFEITVVNNEMMVNN